MLVTCDKIDALIHSVRSIQTIAGENKKEEKRNKKRSPGIEFCVLILNGGHLGTVSFFCHSN